MIAANKTAVITGANSGIGLALVKKLLAEKYHVIGTSRSGKIEALEHPDLKVVQLDITNPDMINEAASQISRLAGSTDLLINNAGIAPDVMSVEPEYDPIMDTFATNTAGTVIFTETILPYMKTGSQIVFISSNMGLPRNAAPNGPAYRMSKAALNMYAAMLAVRMADKGIRVTPMHPGWVQTRLGGSSAPFTAGQSAEGIFGGIVRNTESGKFWDVEVNGVIEY